MVKELNVNLNYLLYGEGPMFRDIEAEGGKGDSLGFPFDLKRLGYKSGNEAVDEFLYYFFNSRYVHYHFLSEFVRLFTQDKDIIKNEIAGLKDNKEPVP